MMFPEVHRSFYHLNFLKNMKTIFQAVGINDFSLSDVTNPKPQRVFLLLEGLIRVAAIVILYKQDGNDIKDEHDKHLQKLHHQKRNIGRLQRQVAEGEAELQRNKSQKFEEQEESIMKKLSILTQEKDEAVENYKKLKQELAANAQKLTDSKDILTSNQISLQKLRELIVSSPEKLTEELREAKRALIISREQRAAAQQRLNTEEGYYKHYSEYASYAEKLKATLESLLTDHMQIRTCARECVDKEEESQSESDKLNHQAQWHSKQLRVTEKEYEEKFKSLQLLIDQSSELEEEISELEERIEVLKKQCELIDAQEAKKSKVLRGQLAKLNELRKRKLEAVAKVDKIVAEGKEKVLLLRKEFDEQMQAFSKLATLNEKLQARENLL